MERGSGSRSRSIRVPTKPSSAGNSVTAEIMTMSTARMVTSAAPRIVDRPMPKRPSRLTTTVDPATSTARPAVSAIAITAPRGARPRARYSR